MFKQTVAMVCVLGAMLCTVAHARPTTFTKRDRGLSDVVRRECKDIMWTSEVMKLTGLDSSQLNLFKVGDIVNVPDNCETLKPSKRVRRATLRILKQQKFLLQAKQTEKDLINTAEERDAWQTKANEVKEQNKNLGTERDAAKAKAEKLEQDNHELLKHKSSSWSYVIGGIVGGIIGAIFAFVATWWFKIRKLVQQRLDDLARISELEEELRISNEKQTELRRRLAKLTAEGRTYSVTYHGKVVNFPTSEHFVGCPFCKEKKITPDIHHMYGHLDKAHTHLLINEITPEEMERKLSQTD